jgi:hypothetical protein
VGAAGSHGQLLWGSLKQKMGLPEGPVGVLKECQLPAAPTKAVQVGAGFVFLDCCSRILQGSEAIVMLVYAAHQALVVGTIVCIIENAHAQLLWATKACPKGCFRHGREGGGGRARRSCMQHQQKLCRWVLLVVLPAVPATAVQVGAALSR